MSVRRPDTLRDDPPPRRPEAPDPGDCCGGGCVNCVFDVYETALEKYQERLTAWRARHPESIVTGD